MKTLIMAGLIINSGCMPNSSTPSTLSVAIKAPLSTSFAFVNGFRRFKDWSTLPTRDPQLKTEVSGPLFGVGAKLSWSGNKLVGSGTLEIVESTPYKSVKIKVTSSNATQPDFWTFTVEPEALGTRMTWKDENPSSPAKSFSNLFGLLQKSASSGNLEITVSALELNRLSGAAEKLNTTDFSDVKFDVETLPAVRYLSLSLHTTTKQADVNKARVEAQGVLVAFMQANQLKPAPGRIMLTHVHGWDSVKETAFFDYGIRLGDAQVKIPNGSPIKIEETCAGLTVKSQYSGSMDNISPFYEKIDSFINAYGLAKHCENWEETMTADPLPSPNFVTDLFDPVQ